MSLTHSRVTQYIGILLILGALGGGYFYWQAKAGSTIVDRAISYNALTSGSATTTDPATTASISPGANRLILAAVTSNSLQSPTLTGNGLTWVEIGASQDAARRTVLFRAMSAAPTTGAVTIDWASAPGEQRWVISEFDNVDTSGTNGSGAIAQSATNFLDLTTSFTITLAEFSAPGNATYGVVQAYTVDSNSISSGSGFSGIVTHGTNFKQQAQYKLGNDTTVDWTNINNVYWRGIAVEIKKKGGTKLNTAIRDSLSEGLAGYWKLDDASGTTATDSSVNAYNGTLTNGPTWSTGRIGGAVTFDGTDDVITAGNNLDIGTGDVTMSAWINAANANQCTTIMGKRLNGGSYAQYTFAAGHFNSSGVCVSSKKIGCFFHAGTIVDNNNTQNYRTTDDILDGSWHHVVCRRTSGQGLSIFVDGVKRLLTAEIANTTNVNTTNSGAFAIGASDGPALPFTGSIDEARLYKRSLSDDEILRLSRTSAPTNPDTRLKGYWSFDGDSISGTTARDLSGSGNNGTLTNGPTVTEGIRGQALNFDGTDDHVSVPDSNSLDITGQLTITAWIKPTSVTPIGDKSIVRKEGGGDNYGLVLGGNGDVPSGNLEFAYFTGSWRIIDSGYKVPNTDWHHIVVTFNYSNTSILFYDNGVLVATKTAAADLTPNTSAVNIGMDVSNKYFSGSIDEVRIYNAALTASEIYNLYQEGNVKVNQSQSNNGDSLNDGLAGYWKMDDASGTTATDSSGNANNGTLTNGPTWGTGQIGGATVFDGTDDYVTIPDAATYTQSALSVSFWTKITNLSSQERSLITKTGTGDRSWQIYSTTGGGVTFCVSNDINDVCGRYGVSSSGAIIVNQWAYVTAVFNGSGSTNATRMQIYVNGVLQTTSFTGTIPASLVDNTSALRLGFPAAGTALPGPIDEVRIYNRALSAEEVTKLYKTTSPTNPETGLVGYWSFNGKDLSGTTAYDRSGKGNNGTLTSGPTITEGRIGQGLSFDGSDDYVNVANESNFDFERTNSFSSCAWFNITTTVPLAQAIVTKLNGSTAGGWELDIEGDRLAVYVQNTWPSNTIGVKTTAAVSTNTWNHGCFTYDGSSTAAGVILYLNGSAQTKTTNYDILSASILNNNNVGIGERTAGGGSIWPLSGKLDEVRIYNRALSATEIANLYIFGR